MMAFATVHPEQKCEIQSYYMKVLEVETIKTQPSREIQRDPTKLKDER